MKGDLPFAEAMEVAKRFKDANIVIRNKVDVEPLGG